MLTVYRKKLSIPVFALILTVLTACNMPRALGSATPVPTIDLPPTTTGGLPPEPVGELGRLIQEWHVATDGSDLNNCQPAPCATIGRALGLALSVTDPEARNQHVIRIAAGTYTLDDSVYRQLNGHVTIIGAGPDATIIDRTVEGSVEGGFAINSTQRVVIEDLTLRNARDCIHIHESSSAEVVVRNVDLIDCQGNGVENRGIGQVDLFNVNIRGAQGQGLGPADSREHGHGILNYGELNIELGEVRFSEKFGIRNLGNLAIDGTIIASNFFEGLNHEAGIAQLNNAIVSENSGAPRPVFGINALSTIEINDSLIRGNDLGILVAPGGSLTMTDSIVRDHPGRALSVEETSTAVVNNSTIQNNAFDGNDITAIYNEGQLTISHTDIVANFASAIYNWGAGSIDLNFSQVTTTTPFASTATSSTLSTIYIQDSAGILNINNSVIAHNQLFEGAAIDSAGETHIINTTVSNNQGLGLNIWGRNSTVSYTTIADNTGYGLLTSRINVDNTIIAHNTPNDCINLLSIDGSTTSSVNIDTDGSCGVEQTHSPASLMLGPLADNGGPTMTHALLPNSPAIDAATGSCPPVDQRDFGRPVGAGCDVGAYETGAVAATESEESEEEGGNATTITVLIPDTPCYPGPGPEWGFVNNFSVGTHLELLGAGFTGNGNQDWVVGTHPTAANTNCWLPGDNVTTGIPFGEMRLITVPPLPTPLPTATPDDPRQPEQPTPCPLDGNGIPKCS